MVINLWATWCVPCVEEMPSLAALSKTLAPDDIAVLPLSSDRGGARVVEAFYQDHGITGLPVLLDPKGAAGTHLARARHPHQPGHRQAGARACAAGGFGRLGHTGGGGDRAEAGREPVTLQIRRPESGNHCPGGGSENVPRRHVPDLAMIRAGEQFRGHQAAGD